MNIERKDGNQGKQDRGGMQRGGQQREKVPGKQEEKMPTRQPAQPGTDAERDRQRKRDPNE